MKHTPGPWKYQKTNGSPTTGQHMISGYKPGYLAEVRDCGSGDVAANSRLIAASPELLEALEVALLWMVCKAEPIVSGTGDPYAAYKRDELQMRRAIAKAKGEQP